MTAAGRSACSTPGRAPSASSARRRSRSSRRWPAILAPALAVGASEARGSAAVGALLAAAEAERVRVATELHDDTLQTLTAMRLTIDRLAAAWQRGDEAAAEQAVEGARKMVSDAIDRTRRLAFEIVPPLLAEGGVSGALRALPEALGMRPT